MPRGTRRSTCPSVRGLVVGRALLFPPDGDVAAAVDIAVELVHGVGSRMTDDSRWVLPLGSASRDGCDVVVDDTTEDWQHTGLRVVDAARTARSTQVPAGEWEYVVVPLAGSARVKAHAADGSDHVAELAGRASVFAGPTDVAYAPAGSALDITGHRGPTRVAVCAARVSGGGTSAVSPPGRDRGAGRAARRRHARRARSATSASPASSMPTRSSPARSSRPAGNWSSYPPHKHDEERPGAETELEEIYYFETQVEGARTGGSAASRGPRRIPARLRHRRAPDRRVRRGPHRRRGAGAARLARARDGRPGLRPVLPQRDGRSRPDPGLADLRRPQPRLGPRHLERPGARPSLPFDPHSRPTPPGPRA